MQKKDLEGNYANIKMKTDKISKVYTIHSLREGDRLLKLKKEQTTKEKERKGKGKKINISGGSQNEER